MPSNQEPLFTASPGSASHTWFSQLALFVGCVGLPALMTTMAPLATVDFVREDGAVHAKVVQRLMFVIPFDTTTIFAVTSVGDSFSSGGTHRSRRSGGSYSFVQADDSAELTIENGSGGVSVPVSPASIDRVLKKARAFLADESKTHLRLITVGSWKFGVFAGGFLCLLTLVYIWVEIRLAIYWLRRLIERRNRSTS